MRIFVSTLALGLAGLTAPSALAYQDEDLAARIAAFETGLNGWRDWGDDEVDLHSIEDRIAHWGMTGAAVAIIRDGEVVHVRGYGRVSEGGPSVDADTLFSVGSVSKVVNAALILRLADRGEVDLDADVAGALPDWAQACTRVDGSTRVSLRQLITHTAGMTVHGFADFEPGEDIPTLREIICADGPAKNDPIRLTEQPGTAFDYSGGGTMLTQVFLEAVTGQDYSDFANAELLDPLGMPRSTFANPLPGDTPNVALAHDEDGRQAVGAPGWHAMPEEAASGLWTSANDLSEFVTMLIAAYRGESDYLSQPLAQEALTRNPISEHGLGPRVQGEGDAYVFHHGGANNSYHAYIEGHLATGDGIVVLTNGARGWALWREIRFSAERAFDWAVKAETDFEDVDIPRR
jgi:CubicO group peptidase (beta-lactamase class C family)